jgi:hypothetical protein
MSVEPRWDIDLPFGEESEARMRLIFGWLHTQGGHCEVKHKRRVDDGLYVELEHNPGGQGWRPSGLNTTRADLWAFDIERTGIAAIIPTDLLRFAVKMRLGRAAVEEDGSCPTRGRLIHLNDLIAVGGRWNERPFE